MMRPSRLIFFVAGILCGFALGALITLLLAPETGEQTRARLAGYTRNMAGTARAFAERAEEAAEILGQRVEHYLGRDEEVAWRKVREIREGVERYSQAQ